MTARSVSALAAVVLLGAAASAYLHRLRRQVRREQTVARLTDTVHERDMTALAAVVRTVGRRDQVLAEAELIVNRALANQPKEG